MSMCPPPPRGARLLALLGLKLFIHLFGVAPRRPAEKMHEGGPVGFSGVHFDACVIL